MSTKKQDKIRYAVVGLGWISQAAFMPGVEETGNSAIGALVSGDLDKAREVGKPYGIDTVYHYDDYEKMLKSGDIDAVYLALPNHLHHEYALATLNAGIPLLLEKPMALNRKECEDIIEAAERNNVELMLAYRLHFEPATLQTIELIRTGGIGEPRLFTSTFAQHVSKENHRSKDNTAGPLMDMGPYPINAVRNLFGEEPLEVMGVATPFRDEERKNVDENVSVTMRFPNNKLAQFTVSYGGSAVDEYRVVGTEGHLRVDPGFHFEKALKLHVELDKEPGKIKTTDFPQTDQFAGQLQYFSDCLINDMEPEPDGYEGLADIAIVEAIQASIDTGTAQKVAAVNDRKQPGKSQKRLLKPVKEPALVGAAKP